MSFTGRDIIQIGDFSKKDILTVLQTAEQMKGLQGSKLLQGKILAALFFEPSTRTKMSFDAAMKRLGGEVIGFSDWRDTSIQKGETLSDTIKVVEGYSDVIVIRHPEQGSAKIAADAAHIPVINGGDGSNEHPTQTFVDLFTIYKNNGSLDSLSIGFVGDLKYGRTVHSLAKALSMFDVDMYFIAPKELEFPGNILKEMGTQKRCFRAENVDEVAKKLDFLYATRIQKERFLGDDLMYKKKFQYCLDADFLKRAKEGMKIMHPLPRVGEIKHELDQYKNALYFEQAHNGVPVRMALLSLVLGKAENLLDGVEIKADVDPAINDQNRGVGLAGNAQ